MRYVSTRGEAAPLDFVEVMLAGLARDGGLYVPERWPALAPEDIAGFAGRPPPQGGGEEGKATSFALSGVGAVINRQCDAFMMAPEPCDCRARDAMSTEGERKR